MYFIKLKQIIRQKSFLIPFAAVTLICCLVVISGLNKPHLNPFTGELHTQYPTAAAYSDNGTVLIDSERQRLLILTEDDKVKAVVNSSAAGSPVEKFISVTIDKGRIFAVGTTAFNHGLYISSEKIVEYDSDGKVVQTVYSENYTEDEKISRERFSFLTAGSDGLYLAKVNDRDVSLIFLSESGDASEADSWKLPEAVHSAVYSSDKDNCFVIGLSQNCYTIDCKSGEIADVSFEEYLKLLLGLFNIHPENVDISSYLGYNCVPAIVLNEDGTAQYCCIIDSDGDVLLVLSNDTSEQYDISMVQYSTPLRFKTIGYWLAVAFIALEVLVALLWLLIEKGQSKGRIVLLVIGVVILISVFYIRQINNASEESYNKALKTQAKQMSYTLSKGCGDIFDAISTDGIYDYCTDLDNQKDLDELRILLKDLCDKNDSDQTCYAGCYLYDTDDILYTFADSANADMAGQPVYTSEKLQRILEEQNQGVITADSYAESLVYDYEPIYSGNGSIVGVFFLCGLRGNLQYVQRQNIINMTVSLAALLIGIYMLFKLYKTFSADILRRRNRADSDVIGKSLDLAGSFSFVQGMVFNIDSALMIYVARSLCTDLSPAKEALMVSLPITMGTFGSMVGVPLSAQLRKRINDRNIAIMSSAATLFAMLLLAFSVSIKNIYIYTLGSFIKSIFLSGVLFSLLKTVPHHAKSDEDKRTALSSVSNGNISASIISALIGGYISQYLSYSAVYFVGAAFCGLLLFLAVVTFPKKSVENTLKDSATGEAASGLKCWTFFMHGPGLIYTVFYLLPFCISNGYKSYLFPLYTSNAGISALLLSNLTVFVRTFSLMTVDGARKIVRKFNNKTAMLIPQFIISACFICFFISPNIYWAITVVFIFELFLRLSEEPMWMYLAKQAENNKLDAKQLSENDLTIKNTFNTLRSPILSTAVSLGMNYACVAVGAVCGVMYTIFLFYERLRNKKVKPNAEAGK